MVTCVMKLVNDIYLNMDRGLITGVLFLDLKKAFDTVDHNILLSKLRMYGVNLDSLKLFQNYLTCRQQKTKVNGVHFDMREISCGVPQGSILGPLLFIIYVNDIIEYITDWKLSLFADDTAIYNAYDNYIDLVLSLRIEIDMLIQWLRAINPNSLQSFCSSPAAPSTAPRGCRPALRTRPRPRFWRPGTGS